MTARFALDDYSAAARHLLPRGPAWPEEPGTVQSMVLRAFARTFLRSDEVASDLLAGSLPGASAAFVDEWEQSLGLPSECTGPGASLDQRLQQIRGRFVGTGGLSRQRYIDFAAALGFDITIATYAPFRAGRSAAGAPCSSHAWTFVLGVTIIGSTGALPVHVLMCELDAIKPAESTFTLLD